MCPCNKFYLVNSPNFGPFFESYPNALKISLSKGVSTRTRAVFSDRLESIMAKSYNEQAAKTRYCHVVYFAVRIIDGPVDKKTYHIRNSKTTLKL